MYPSAVWKTPDGATIVVGVAIAGMYVIAVAFLAPEQLFDSTLGATVFFAAVVLMVAYTVIADSPFGHLARSPSN